MQKPQRSPYEKKLFQIFKLVEAGRSNEVLSTLQEISKTHPKDFRVFDLLCTVNKNMGRHQEAIIAGQRATQLCKDAPTVRTNYAMALQKGGEYETALLEFERVLYHAPNDLQAMQCKLSVYTDLGDHQKSLETLEQIDKVIKKQKLPPNRVIGITLNKARLAPKTLPAQQVIDELNPLTQDHSLPAGFRVIAHHQLGRLYDTLNDHDHAFEHWEKGNELNKPKWDPDVFTQYINKLIKCWEKIDKVPQSTLPTAASIDPERLIFVTGMMRSGTSLTEQMIAQLPNVTPGGEMNAVSRAAFPFEPHPNPLGSRPFPITRINYTQRAINEIAKSAAAMYNDVAKTGLITDKQPNNIFYIPLIARIFPNAKIVHCCRNAQDCCFSNYIQTFARPHPHTHDLYWLGRYHADYQRMMDTWHSLDLINMIDLHYEKVVDDPETQSKRLCQFLGQPWTEDILNFHTSSRTVRTASRDQVRKPIYKSSVKKHETYATHLAPLRQGLGLEN